MFPSFRRIGEKRDKAKTNQPTNKNKQKKKREIIQAKTRKNALNKKKKKKQ